MYLNPFVVQRVAEERLKAAVRRAEEARLVRAVEGPEQSRFSPKADHLWDLGQMTKVLDRLAPR